MRSQRPSCLFIALLVLLVSLGLGALIVSSVSQPRPPTEIPTAAPAVTVLPTSTRPTSTPLPTATLQPTEGILRPTSTRVPPPVLVDTPTPTETPRPTRTVVIQQGGRRD